MRKLTLLAMAAILAFAMAACSSGNTGSNSSGNGGGNAADGKSGETVELTMWMFTGTGLEPFVEQYQKDHPNIKVKIQQQEYADHHNGLVTALEAGGAPDIALVEIGYMDRFKADESKFHNLADFGANDIMGDYLEWKKVQASSQDQNFIFGIPTDVGPMAMMYRTDLFEQAGLPTDPAQVAQEISTWDAFMEAAKKMKSATGKPMVDTSLSTYEVIKGQLTNHYFDSDGNLIAETNPGIKKAYDYAAALSMEGLSGKIAQWSPEWGAGMNNGDFAVQMAPAWMMGFMKANAPDSKGKWNVAPMPEGSGNWGGSFLTVPQESKHPAEAFALIKWLLAPEQQLALFKSNNNFPSTPSIYEDPAIQNYTDEFFSGAPVGKIYAEAAKKVVPVYYGPDYTIVNTPITNALTEVERNGGDPEAEWQKAMDQIKRDLRR
ncbi:ABC transporter substrate-binding protein [Paenibacillus abyssi]|uniref:ABC transporter substrate-binding protein n=2 Tax=Paenibacillus abyssi TaxID=1340531 RepID=A0A917FWD8_9BACL|nr:ABC transporter substrate-binding protein [Paenibacillus abyssi]